MSWGEVRRCLSEIRSHPEWTPSSILSNGLTVGTFCYAFAVYRVEHPERHSVGYIRPMPHAKLAHPRTRCEPIWGVW